MGDQDDTESYFDQLTVYQLISYALLDIEDRYRIEYVALYRARFGSAQRWPLQPLLTTLAGRPVELGRIRAEFCTAARNP